MTDDATPPPDPAAPPEAIDWLPRLVAECMDHGYSPTLETWTARVRERLEPLAADEQSPRSAGDARLVLDAWALALTEVARAWEEADRPCDPDAGGTPDSAPN